MYTIVTKSMSYKRYREFLFQKVASGYELPFVQPGSSKNALKHFPPQIYQTSDSLDTKGVSKIYKIVTKTISYKRYGKILFQKVA